MKIKNICALALIDLGAIALFTTSFANYASAISYNGNTVYKATERGVTNVYIDGVAQTKVAVDIGLVNKRSAKIVGACGEVKISRPSGNPNFSGLTVNGVRIDASSLPTQSLPACTNGHFAHPRTVSFKTRGGQVILVGKTPNTSVSIALLVEQTKHITVNACGFAVLHPPKGGTLPATFNIANNSYTLANLPDAGHGPVCKKTVNGYAAYTPANWSSNP